MPTKYTVRFIETDEDGHVEGKKKATFLADNDIDAFAKVLSKAYGISKEEFVADYLEGYDSESEDFVIGVKEFFNSAYEGDTTLIDWIENTSTHDKIYDSGANWDEEESEDW